MEYLIQNGYVCMFLDVHHCWSCWCCSDHWTHEQLGSFMLPKGWSKSCGPALVPLCCVLFWEHLLDSFGDPVGYRMSFWTVGLLPSMESLEKERHELNRGSHTLTLRVKKLCWKTSRCWVMSNERSWPKHKSFSYFSEWDQVSFWLNLKGQCYEHK